MPNDETALLVRGVLSLGRRLRAERPPDSLSLSAISILATLRRLAPMSQARLAAAEGLQPQSLTRIIADLERRKLVCRAPATHDRRERTIAATSRGLAILAADMRARCRWLDEAMAATLTRTERQMLTRSGRAMLRLAVYANGSLPRAAGDAVSRDRDPPRPGR